MKLNEIISRALFVAPGYTLFQRINMITRETYFQLALRTEYGDYKRFLDCIYKTEKECIDKSWELYERSSVI